MCHNGLFASSVSPSLATESFQMIDAHIRGLTELQVRILRAIQDLEDHRCALPPGQRESVERSIETLKKTFYGEETIVSNEHEHR
jgi:predicted alpha/beta superfamily hydrolase